jgi:tight adherence protein B
MVALAVGLTFLAVFFGVLAVAPLGEHLQRAPMRRILSRFSPPGGRKTAFLLLRDNTLSALPVVHRWLMSAPFAQRLARYLEQADISQRVGVVLALVLLLAFFAGHLAWRLTASWLWAGLAMSGSGSVPLLYVQRRRRIRLGRYAEQLPDALDLLSQCLKVGQSLPHGIQAVAREMPEPARTEFRRTHEELRLGRSLREAFRSHAARVESMEFNLLAAAMLLQREVGGNLTELLETASQTIRERYKLFGQVRALSAQNRLAAKILTALPFVLGVAIYLLRPDLIMVLLTEETGRTLLGLAIVMVIVGVYAMKRITTIKV